MESIEPDPDLVEDKSGQKGIVKDQSARYATLVRPIFLFTITRFTLRFLELLRVSPNYVHAAMRSLGWQEN